MFMEAVYYVTQIIASLAVIAGTIIALIQYIFNSKQAEASRKRELELHELEVKELEKDRIQKAIDLSEYFKDHILYYMNMLKYVYDKAGVSDILNDIPRSNIAHFDTPEMERNISASNRDFLQTVRFEPKFKDALAFASTVSGFWPECREVYIDKDGDWVKSQVLIKESELTYRFGIMLQDLLNNLEYFAMAFTHETADASVIYQSIHRSYIKVVELLYYDISLNNQPGQSKLFTNVIELYTMWKNESESQVEEELSNSRNNIRKGNTL